MVAVKCRAVQDIELVTMLTEIIHDSQKEAFIIDGIINTPGDYSWR
jgi:hypothetical protein